MNTSAQPPESSVPEVQLDAVVSLRRGILWVVVLALVGWASWPTAPLPVIPREQWGARAPREAYMSHVPQVIVLHHSFIPTAARYNGAVTIRGIQNDHMDRRGFIDIGYHYLVGPDGKIFEGRPPDAVGAHTVPNAGKIGICCIGDFERGREKPTAAQLESLVTILVSVIEQWKIPVNSIQGHCDFQTTVCPGAEFYEMLPAIRRRVEERLRRPRPARCACKHLCSTRADQVN